MERPKCFFCVIIFFLSGFVSVYGQNNHKKEIYQAYINGNMSDWQNTIEDMERKELSESETFELLSYYYGYIGYLIGNKNSKLANSYIKKGETLIDGILKKNPSNATANAYKGSFTSFKIALKKMKAVTLGPKSMEYINKAYKLDSKNVQALADKGNMLYYAPGMFGGDKKEAIRYFEKAIKTIESNNDITDNWFYLNLLTLLAQYYNEMDRKQDALSTYEKILRIEPNFKWVRDELYPNQLKSN